MVKPEGRHGPGPEDAAMLQGIFEGIEQARAEAEIKWGVGRLEILASDDLRSRWRRQQASWRAAYEAAWTSSMLTRDQVQLVRDKAAAMRRGWQALDAAAEEAGHRPVAPWVWEVPLAGGVVAALVQTDAEASKVIAEGRFVVVYTAAEIGCALDALPDCLALAKQVWPGAKLQRSRSVGNALGAPPWNDAGDAIPFGEPPDGKIPFGNPVEGEPDDPAEPWLSAPRDSDEQEGISS